MTLNGWRGNYSQRLAKEQELQAQLRKNRENMGFNPDEYETVASRLARWIDSCKERGLQHRVETALMEYTDNRCVFRATIYEGDTAVATGWAEETRGEGMVNRTSHLENCESSSIGRALANAGLSGSDPKRRPSKEEMQKVQRIQGPPQVVRLDERKGGDRPATDKQIETLRRMMTERGMDTDSVEWAILTFQEASDRIDATKSVPRL